MYERFGWRLQWFELRPLRYPRARPSFRPAWPVGAAPFRVAEAPGNPRQARAGTPANPGPPGTALGRVAQARANQQRMTGVPADQSMTRAQVERVLQVALRQTTPWRRPFSALPP